MSRTILFPPMTKAQLDQRTIARQLELSLRAAAVHQILIEAWMIPSPASEMPQQEQNYLRLVADRAVGITQPGERDKAEAAAQRAFRFAMQEAIANVMAGETHSQAAYIQEGCEKLAQHLVASGLWAGVISAYQSSLDGSRVESSAWPKAARR